MIYSQLKSNQDFKVLMKELFFTAEKSVEELQLPPMKYLSYVGRGAPGSRGFQNAIQALYGVAYTLKMGLKYEKLARPDEYFDYSVPPLEGLWWQVEGNKSEPDNKWQWRLMMMQPSFITTEMVYEAQFLAKSKHSNIPYYHVRLERFNEGKVIQLLHIGPYDKAKADIDKLIEYAEVHGYEIAGQHHEIYLSDPRRAKPQNLKTVLRYAVKRKGSK